MLQQKAYKLEASALYNVDKWFDEVEQAISFEDSEKYRRGTIAFIVLLSIGAAITLALVVREAVRKAKKLTWVNKKAYNLYRYIKIVIIVDLIVTFICGNHEFLIALETLVKNGLLLFYLRKKAMHEYSEDYLVPQWFIL